MKEGPVPSISAVVCTYNRADVLRTCLESLAGQTLDKGQYEVLVIDNDSSDETADVMSAFLEEDRVFRMVKETRQGLSHARNRGYEEARGDYVAYLDDDAIAGHDWLENILRAFETVRPAPAAVGGLTLPFYLTQKPSWFLDEYETYGWGDKACFLTGPSAHRGFFGMNMSFRREVLIGHGGFPVDFGMKGSRLGGGEETALFYEIYKDSPFFWYDPQITVRHLVREECMRVPYRLKRTFLVGINQVHIEGIRPFSMKAARSLAAIPVYGVFLFADVIRRRQCWQRSLMKHANPMAVACGKLYAMFSLGERRHSLFKI